MSTLSKQALINCDSSSVALSPASATSYLDQLKDWALDSEAPVLKLSRCYAFPDFNSALRFTNLVGDLADRENHHPRVCIEWGRVQVSWWTHSLDGLFINDFIMAARCDDLYHSKG